MCELLISVAPLVSKHGPQSDSGPKAKLLCNMWAVPRPGIEPTSPALAGRFFTTEPPEKSPKEPQFCVARVPSGLGVT